MKLFKTKCFKLSGGSEKYLKNLQTEYHNCKEKYSCTSNTLQWSDYTVYTSLPRTTNCLWLVEL